MQPQKKVMVNINLALGRKINERLLLASGEHSSDTAYRVQILVIGGKEAREMVASAIDVDHSTMQSVSSLEMAVDEIQRGNVPDIIVMDESASHQEVMEFLSTSGIDALIPLIPVQSKALKPEPRALRSMIRELSPAFVFA